LNSSSFRKKTKTFLNFSFSFSFFQYKQSFSFSKLKKPSKARIHIHFIHKTFFHFFHMAVAAVVSPPTIRQQIEQQPPAYILQSWRREQANLHDHYLLRQTFLIAPDTAVPFSRLRQHIRNIYEERARPVIVVHYEPWAKEAFGAGRAQTASTSTKDLPTNVDFVRSHTTL
jgi:hypothetical protein